MMIELGWSLDPIQTTSKHETSQLSSLVSFISTVPTSKSAVSLYNGGEGG